MLVAVSGRHGAGKTTLAKAIADHFNLIYVSAGALFREMAKKHGMNIVEFTRYAKKHPEIDRTIDERMKQEASKGGRVLDAQLAYFFSEQFHPFNILVFAEVKDIVKRVSEREGLSLKEARNEVRTREKNEKKRFKKLYGIELWNPTDFHIMINTSRITKEKAKKIAIDSISIFQGELNFTP